ncbi:IclR family transcriptional regulator [Segeticoccus rhizosphaerae]|uniref:IclR family transcriptional regulator n=1 Tax=Segeticoccus rhizosphaerae TaxID=1104777 RepID=UPI0010C09F43|nr:MULTISPECIES: IclR family transcriptional regulator [Intrasporangiaceae]
MGTVPRGKVQGVRPGTSGRIQSVERAFAVLEAMVDAGGAISLTDLSDAVRLPLPTIHRLLRTFVELGYVRQEPSRQYVLGPGLIRLGETSSLALGTWARPHLARLVDELGESANLAMLEGDRVVYVGQVPSRHSMRMFTEVGRQVPAHCTAVGKAMLARESADQVRTLLDRAGMLAQTEHTITTPDAMFEELDRVRRDGYAMDNGEQEVGVRCVGVAVPEAPFRVAMSVSGPATRISDAFVQRAVPQLLRAAADLSRDLRRAHA